MQKLALEGLEAGQRLEKETAKGPDVGFGGVGNPFEDLGGHVAGGADGGAGEVFRGVEGARNPEVADLDLMNRPVRSGSRAGS